MKNWGGGKIDSKETLIRLIDQYKNLVFSVCLRLTGDYFTAEDLTQETFLSAYQHWHEFDGNAEKAWLCRIAANKCIDWKRAAARKQIATAQEDLPEISTEEKDEPLNTILGKEILSKLADSCEALPPPYQEVAKMYFVQGMTAKEISEQTTIKYKTIQTQIYRAREMLKKQIRKEELLE